MQPAFSLTPSSHFESYQFEKYLSIGCCCFQHYTSFYHVLNQLRITGNLLPTICSMNRSMPDHVYCHSFLLSLFKNFSCFLTARIPFLLLYTATIYGIREKIVNFIFWLRGMSTCQGSSISFRIALLHRLYNSLFSFTVFVAIKPFNILLEKFL